MRKDIFLIGSILTLSNISSITAGTEVAAAKPSKEPITKPVVDYQAKTYTNLLGMPGFSDDLLNMHFQLYQGYVKNTNLLLNTIRTMALSGGRESLSMGSVETTLRMGV